MRRLATLLLPVTLAVLLSAMPAAAGGSRSASRPYIEDANLPVTVYTCLGLPQGLVCGLQSSCEATFGNEGYGGNCFPLDGSEKQVSIGLADSAGLTPGAMVYFLDQSGHHYTGPGQYFCGSGSFGVPAGSATMNVLVSSGMALFAPCGWVAKGFGTTGMIDATFSY